MFDFRLKVFHTVARRLNFTKAAEELFITQPAVTKHVHEIEAYYKVKLFERNGGKIKLTEPGKVLLKYTERIFDIYREVEFDLNSFTQNHKGVLRIGASTTVAQYILPPLLAGFHTKFKDIRISLLTENTQQIEAQLEQKNLDLGIIEGRSKSTSFKYTHLTKDEIVLVAAANHPKAKKGAIRLEELPKTPLLTREQGSGTLEFIAYELKKAGIKLSDLQIEMQMNSPESIKAYLLNSDCMAFLSIHSVLKELAHKELTVIDVKGLTIERSFNIIHAHGGVSGLADLFMKYAVSYNFR